MGGAPPKTNIFKVKCSFTCLLIELLVRIIGSTKSLDLRSQSLWGPHRLWETEAWHYFVLTRRSDMALAENNAFYDTVFCIQITLSLIWLLGTFKIESTSFSISFEPLGHFRGLGFIVVLIKSSISSYSEEIF